MKFFGEYIHQVDDNGRIRIPSAFKEKLGTKYKIMLGVGRSLVIMDCDEYDQLFSKKFGDIDPTDKQNIKALRLWYSNSSEAEYDKQGRVLLPNVLKKKAGIEKNIVIIGVGNWIEIWDEDNWKNYTTENNFDDVLTEFNKNKV